MMLMDEMALVSPQTNALNEVTFCKIYRVHESKIMENKWFKLTV